MGTRRARRILVAIGLAGSAATTAVAVPAAPAVAAPGLVATDVPGFAGLLHASTDGRYAAVRTTVEGASHVALVDLGTGQVRDLTAAGVLGDGSSIRWGSFSGGGRYVMQGTARIDLQTGAVLQPDLAAAAAVLGAVLGAERLSADGRYALVQFANGLARVDLATGAHVPVPVVGQPLAMSPNGRYAVVWSCPVEGCAAAGFIDGVASVVDLPTRTVLATFASGFTQGAYAVTAVDDRGHYVETAVGLTATSTLVDPATGRRLPLGSGQLLPEGFPDPYSDDLGVRLAVGGFGVTSVVRSLDGWRWRFETASATAPGELLSGDGTTVIAVDDRGGATARLVPRTGTFAPRQKQLAGLQVLRLPTYYLAPGPVLDLNVTVTEPDAAGYLRVWNCDEPMPATSNVNFDAGETVANHVLVDSGSGGVCFYANVSAELVVDRGGTLLSTGPYRGLAPARLVDTREPGSGVARTAAGTALSLEVAGGASRVPADARAVVLNVTATGASTPGYVTAWPCGLPQPVASNVNVEAGQTRAALVTVAPGAGGRVCVASNVQLDLVVDRSGYFDATAPLTATDPVRLLDTREPASGSPYLKAGEVIRVPLAEALPHSEGFRTAFVNVTVTNPLAAGFVTMWPCDADRPLASVVNAPAASTRSNSVAAALGEDGTVCIYNQVATDVIVDRFGVYTEPVLSTSLWAVSPSRWVDTRDW